MRESTKLAKKLVGNRIEYFESEANLNNVIKKRAELEIKKLEIEIKLNEIRLEFQEVSLKNSKKYEQFDNDIVVLFKEFKEIYKDDFKEYIIFKRLNKDEMVS